jgi:hypothetical protein
MSIRLDDLLTESIEIQSTETAVQQSVDPVITFDLDAVLREWSYRCDKGYPEMGNPADMLHLQNILEELGIESPFSKIEEAPAKIPVNKVNTAILNLQKPVVSTNKTSIKEGLVCLFYDCFKDSSLRANILDLQKLKRSKIGKGVDISGHPDLNDTLNKISKVFRQNVNNYGTGTNAVKSLDEYVKYVWLTGEDLPTLNNAISAANTIHNEKITGTVIRNQTFDAIRALAVSLIKKDYDISLFPDNWCPGDIYIIRTPGAETKALSSKTLNIGKDSLNSKFGKKSGIVAVSLKEEIAQAGKASTFADTVFTKSYKSNLSPNVLLGTTSKGDVRVTASIDRYLGYMYGNPKAKRAKSYINALLKKGMIHKSVNTILNAAGLPQYKTSNIVSRDTTNEAEFFENNKKIFDALNTAVESLKGKLQDEKKVNDTRKKFIEARNKFIAEIKNLNVEVETPASATFAKQIEEAAGPDTVKTFAMKTSTYELASLIINKWLVDIENISPAYKKIATITNPFVALTAFAIAEAGLSPSFWKVIGNERSLSGVAHYFDTNSAVGIDTKTSPIKLVDSPGQAGFALRYITTVDKHRFDTQLTFRFSNDTIRIEVEKLVEI